MLGVGVGVGVQWSGGGSSGGGPPPWTPAEDTALFWIDAPAARAGGRLFTTSTKVTTATAAADPVGAVVQEGGLGNDHIQATASRRYFLTTLSDGQWALGSDGIDDCLQSTTVTYPAGAKTVGFRLEYSAAIGASELDIALFTGSAAGAIRVQISGPSSGVKGLNFIVDTSASNATRRYSSFVPTAGVPFTVVIAYNGGSITSTASYRLFIDGVEVIIDTTGTAWTGSAQSTILCSAVAGSPLNGKMSKVFVVDGDQSAKISRIQTYLVAP